MENLINFDDVNTKIITVRNQNVILDSDVATLYGVEAKRVNEAVKNNPDKFPEGYVIEVSHEEFTNLKKKNTTSNSEESLRSKISTLNKQGRGQHKKYLPNVFTERGLYMLATILKSPQATQATIAIVETFAKLKQLTNSIAILNSIDPEVIEPEIIESTVEKTGGLLNELFFCGIPTSTETSVEFNIGIMKGKRTVKSEAGSAVLNELEALKKRMEQLEKTLKQG